MAFVHGGHQTAVIVAGKDMADTCLYAIIWDKESNSVHLLVTI